MLPQKLLLCLAAVLPLNVRSFSSQGAFSATRNLIGNCGTRCAKARNDDTSSSFQHRRKDYSEPSHWIKNVELDFNIQDHKTTVTSELTIFPNSNTTASSKDLILDGDASTISLISLSIEGNDLHAGTDYIVSAQKLVIKATCLPGSRFVLRTVVDLFPDTPSKELLGLYKRDGMYCTHCEPSGFRRITYFRDRPDNCAIFDRVRIEADIL